MAARITCLFAESDLFFDGHAGAQLDVEEGDREVYIQVETRPGFAICGGSTFEMSTFKFISRTTAT